MTGDGETGLNYTGFIERLLIKGELVGHSISNVNVMACVLLLRTRTGGGNCLISSLPVLSFDMREATCRKVILQDYDMSTGHSQPLITFDRWIHYCMNI
jgi:hypothetical protein